MKSFFKNKSIRTVSILLFIFMISTSTVFSQTRPATHAELALQEKIRSALQNIFGKLQPMDGKFFMGNVRNIGTGTFADEENRIEPLEMMQVPKTPFEVSINAAGFLTFSYGLKEPYLKEYGQQLEEFSQQMEMSMMQATAALGKPEFNKIAIRADSMILAKQVVPQFTLTVSINHDYLTLYNQGFKDQINILFPLEVPQAAYAWHVFTRDTWAPVQYSQFYFGKNWPGKTPKPTDKYNANPYLFKSKAGSLNIENIVVAIQAPRPICEWFARNVNWEGLNVLLD